MPFPKNFYFPCNKEINEELVNWLIDSKRNKVTDIEQDLHFIIEYTRIVMFMTKYGHIQFKYVDGYEVFTDD